MGDHTFSYTTPLRVQNHHLMVLIAPINAHKPSVHGTDLGWQLGVLRGLDSLHHTMLLFSLGVSHGL
jgi:hypothetical protein